MCSAQKGNESLRVIIKEAEVDAARGVKQPNEEEEEEQVVEQKIDN